MRRFTLVTIATLLALAAVVVTALAMEPESAGGMPAAPSQDARLAVAHMAPFAADPGTAVTVTLDSTPVLTNVEFADSTGYLVVPTGTHLVEIWPAGSADPAITKSVTFSEDTDYSAIAIGDGVNQPVGAFAWPSGAAGGLLKLAANLQAAHLAPFAMDPNTAVTVTVDTTPLLLDFEFADSTGYVPVKAGVDHLIQVFPAGSPDPAISATVNLTHAMDFSAIAIGGANGWDLDLLLLEDDNTPATGTPGAAKVRIGHLAPFADTITKTVADVWVNGGVFLNDVPYLAVTGYTELVPGKYELELTPGDGTLRVFGPASLMLHTDDIASVFAVGDGANQPVAIFVWPNGEPGFLLRYMTYLPLALRAYTGTAVVP